MFRFIIIVPMLILVMIGHAIGLHGQAPSDTTIAVVNVTLIDGNGGPPQPNMTVVIANGRLAEVNRAVAVTVPRGARTVDGTGLWMVPGFVNTNVFFTYIPCEEVDPPDLYQRALGCAKQHLRWGETTVIDTHGFMDVLVRLREAIRRGDEIGSRLLVAGNILGWGRTCSSTGPQYQEPCDGEPAAPDNGTDSLIGHYGDELVTLSLDSLRARVNAFLDRGPDLVKYLGTSHHAPPPTLPVFTRRQQEVIIETVHQRGRFVTTHCSTVEGMRDCALAGVDMFQHATGVEGNTAGVGELPDDVAELVGKNQRVCSVSHPIFPIPAEAANFVKLMKSGCTISLETDDNGPLFPVIAGAVSKGMTPLQAITAATRNGAIAAHLLSDIGTIEKGKVADVILLTADPVANIQNLQQIKMVIAKGKIVP